jgi:hypothetical protein
VLIAGRRVSIEPLALMLDQHAGRIEAWPDETVGRLESLRNAGYALAFARSILEQP